MVTFVVALEISELYKHAYWVLMDFTLVQFRIIYEMNMWIENRVHAIWLTPWDYFSLRYAKFKCLLISQRKCDNLKTISDSLLLVLADWLGRKCDNWTSRLKLIRSSRRGHMTDYLFKSVMSLSNACINSK